MPCPLSDIFDVRYGHSLELNALEISNAKDGVPFVGRQMDGNGISAYVVPIPDLDPAPAGDVSCALGGNGVLTTFVQEAPFYCGRDVAILRSKGELSKQQILFYCLCIKSNRFRFSYGRQANRTLNNLLIPDLEEVPAWVSSFDLNQAAGTESRYSEAPTPPLAFDKWKEFRYEEVFDIRKGYYNKKLPELKRSPESVPFIGATEGNNGVTSYHRLEDIATYGRNGDIEAEPTTDKKVFPANGITVANNGASVGYAFFQAQPFTSSHDVNPLYLLSREMTPEIGMFLCSIIRMDRYRWSYGRKWRPSRMPQSIIKLPVRSDGKLDWDFMETYVRSLPFSKAMAQQ